MYCATVPRCGLQIVSVAGWVSGPVRFEMCLIVMVLMASRFQIRHLPCGLNHNLQTAAALFHAPLCFEPPNPALDVLVLHSRASSRAQWAAQLCLDAGSK